SLPNNWDTNKNTFLDARDTDWMENALSRFGGNLKDTAMGVKPINPPLPFVEGEDGKTQAAAGDLIQRATNNDSSDMRQHKMEYMADYIIEGDPSSFKKVTDVNNNEYWVPEDNALKI